MATSAAPAFKAALHAACVAAFPAGTVQVCYGRPGAEPWADDALALLDVDATQAAAPMGTRAREETFTLTVLCSSFRAGGDEMQQVATEAAYGLLATLEGLLRTDPNVTGTVRKAEVVGHLLAEESYAQGRVAEVAAAIAVQARLT